LKVPSDLLRHQNFRIPRSSQSDSCDELFAGVIHWCREEREKQGKQDKKKVTKPGAKGILRI